MVALATGFQGRLHYAPDSTTEWVAGLKRISFDLFWWQIETDATATEGRLFGRVGGTGSLTSSPAATYGGNTNTPAQLATLLDASIDHAVTNGYRIGLRVFSGADSPLGRPLASGTNAAYATSVYPSWMNGLGPCAGYEANSVDGSVCSGTAQRVYTLSNASGDAGAPLFIPLMWDVTDPYYSYYRRLLDQFSRWLNGKTGVGGNYRNTVVDLFMVGGPQERGTELSVGYGSSVTGNDAYSSTTWQVRTTATLALGTTTSFTATASSSTNADGFEADILAGAVNSYFLIRLNDGTAGDEYILCSSYSRAGTVFTFNIATNGRRWYGTNIDLAATPADHGSNKAIQVLKTQGVGVGNATVLTATATASGNTITDAGATITFGAGALTNVPSSGAGFVTVSSVPYPIQWSGKSGNTLTGVKTMQGGEIVTSNSFVVNSCVFTFSLGINGGPAGMYDASAYNKTAHQNTTDPTNRAQKIYKNATPDTVLQQGALACWKQAWADTYEYMANRAGLNVWQTGGTAWSDGYATSVSLVSWVCGKVDDGSFIGEKVVVGSTNLRNDGGSGTTLDPYTYSLTLIGDAVTQSAKDKGMRIAYQYGGVTGSGLDPYVHPAEFVIARYKCIAIIETDIGSVNTAANLPGTGSTKGNSNAAYGWAGATNISRGDYLTGDLNTRLTSIGGGTVNVTLAEAYVLTNSGSKPNSVTVTAFKGRNV